MSNEIKLTVKDEGIIRFFEKYITQDNKDNMRGSCYYFMKDTLYLKKECGLVKGDVLKIELGDSTYGSQKSLVNHYWYEAVTYDDVVVEMVLVNFEIKMIN